MFYEFKMSFDTNSKKITVGIFAHPVSHSASPAMHNRAFKKLGLNYTYEAFNVPPDKLTDAIQDIRNRNLRGVNLTIPHKEKVMPFLDEISDDAKKIGAVNTILHDKGRLEGFNTDWSGFNEALDQKIERDRWQVDFATDTIGILGAGGSAKAVLYGLLARGAQDITIFNRTREKAENLVQSFQGSAEKETVLQVGSLTDTHLLEKIKLIMNCTSVGMQGTAPALPVDLDCAKSVQYVVDLIYNPLETLFLAAAQKKGLGTMNGVDMLVTQGAKSFELWTGLYPPMDVMRDAVCEFVNQQKKGF